MSTAEAIRENLDIGAGEPEFGVGIADGPGLILLMTACD